MTVVRAIRRYPVLVLGLLLLAGTLAAAGVALGPPVYRAELRVSVTFGPPGAPAASDPSSTVDVAAALGVPRRLIESRVRGYAQLATSEPVVRQVISTLGLPDRPDDLAARIETTVPLDTTWIDIAVTDSDPSRAALIATVVQTTLAGVADSEPHTSDPASTIRLAVPAPATPPTRPEPASWPSRAVAGALAGLVLGAGLAWARDLARLRRETLPAWLAARAGRLVPGRLRPAVQRQVNRRAGGPG